MYICIYIHTYLHTYIHTYITQSTSEVATFTLGSAREKKSSSEKRIYASINVEGCNLDVRVRVVLDILQQLLPFLYFFLHKKKKRKKILQ